jgi:hypothetical protein
VQQSYADQNFRAKPSTAHGVQLLDGLNHNNNIFPSSFFFKEKDKTFERYRGTKNQSISKERNINGSSLVPIRLGKKKNPFGQSFFKSYVK